MIMQEYYKKRAREYEEIYHRDDPVRQKEQRLITEAVRQHFMGRNVLEIACGTGYWTRVLSQSAKLVIATDLVPEVIEIAQAKDYGCPVTFKIEDAYNLSFQAGEFNGALANFWFSHIPKKDIQSFFDGLHRVLENGSKIFIADNVNVPGVGGEFITKANDENTYKLRTLKDGSKELILKNYYTPEQLVSIFSKFDPSFFSKDVFYGKAFWYLAYTLKK
jgi:ubiquinone/menaquinone biosynthesis C-methylase UbiE